MKVALVTFVGDPALPQPVQNEVAKSLREHDYNDNKEGMNELVDRVRDAWQHHGYFNVKVGPSDSQTLREDPESRTVAITLNVNAGKQYRLDEIHFASIAANGQRPLPVNPVYAPEEQKPVTEDRLRAVFQIQPGDIFDTHKIQEGLAELRKAHGARGFINFTSVPSTQIDEDNGRITLFLEIDEGKQFRVGKLDVTGMESEALRRALVQAELVPGKVFNASSLELFARQSEGIVSDFKPEDDVERRIHEDSNTIDLIIHVRSCDPAP
jgi:outer membrane protein insertion porin family